SKVHQFSHACSLSTFSPASSWSGDWFRKRRRRRLGMELGEFACGEIPTKSVISCLLTPFSVIVSAMLGDIWQSIPQIIKEAATSPLGLLALMIVALAILAFYFFRDAGVPIRVTIFILLFAAVVVFAAKVAYKANEVVAAEKPLSKPVPS